MINLFKLAPLDQSINYLVQLFGDVNGVIPGNAGTSAILGNMFKLFNSVILAVAVLMLVYITIVGVIATAHEGEFMGKKWNNIWIPIRAVLGVALLVPTSAGFCGIQIIMMWVIVQGIGAADTLWTCYAHCCEAARWRLCKTNCSSCGYGCYAVGFISGINL